MPRFRLIAIIVVLLAAVTGAALAQDAPTETYTSAELNLEFDYPEGWVPVEVAEYFVVVLADSEFTIDNVNSDDPMTSGMVTINIYAPGFIAAVYGDTPRAVIDAFLVDFPQTPLPETSEVDLGDGIAVQFEYIDDHSSGLVIAYEMPDGTVGMSIADTASGEMDTILDTVYTVLASVRTTDPAAGESRGRTDAAPESTTDIELTESYTVQYGGLTFEHPRGWYPISGETLDPPGSVIVTDSRSTANTEAGAPIPEGGVFISLYPPEWVQAEFSPFDTDIDAVWQGILDGFYGGYPVEETDAITVQDEPARMFAVALEGYDFMTVLFAIGEGEYVMAAISIAEGEYTTREPLVLDILETVTIDADIAAQSDALKKSPVPGN